MVIEKPKSLEELEAELTEKIRSDEQILARIKRITSLLEQVGGGLKEERSSSVGKWTVGDMPLQMRKPHRLITHR